MQYARVIEFGRIKLPEWFIIIFDIALLPENQNNPEGYTTVGNYYSAYETYFDPHGPGDDYWSFELQPGETQNFTIEFLIDRVYLSQKDPFLAITPGREIFYGVMLRDLAKWKDSPHEKS